MFSSLPDFCYERQNIPDAAHAIGGVFKMLVRILVGPNHGQFAFFSKMTNAKDRRHRLECEYHNVFPATWVHPRGQLPWQLTPQALLTVDARVRSVVYPHRMETVGSPEHSFFRRPSYASKLTQRLTAFMFVLPTCLRGYVPNVHKGFCDLILGLRILHGMVYSPRTCRRLNLEPGSFALKKTDVEVAHRLLVDGLSKLEGSMPVGVQIIHIIIVAMHVFVSLAYPAYMFVF